MKPNIPDDMVERALARFHCDFFGEDDKDAMRAALAEAVMAAEQAHIAAIEALIKPSEPYEYRQALLEAIAAIRSRSEQEQSK